MDWLVAANGNKYDHSSAFQKWGFIDWKQGNRKYSVGDNIYIYCTLPIKKVMYKTVVERVCLTNHNKVNDSEFWHEKDEYDGYFARLRLVEQVDREELTLENLLINGLNSAPQGPIKLNMDLKRYIDKYINDTYNDNTFPDSANTEACFEGAKTTVEVNKYERSSVARQKCIDHHGCYCNVCEISFEKVYAEVGKGFIHVHHLIPLNEIGEKYNVDPINDLIPVCPNCHAMLHRKLDGRYLSVDELKAILKK